MKNSIIKLMAGTYENTDAYERVLTYVMSKDYVGGYSLYLPLNRDSVITQFHYAEDSSLHHNSRMIWHFTVSVGEIRSHRKLLLLGNHIASIFADKYQVVYSLDLETGKYHLHFAVNAYSHTPSVEPLSEFHFTGYVSLISEILHIHFPNHPIYFIDGNKGGNENV